MSDLLRIGTSSTSTYKTALEIAGHNIANATTEGYSRQRADIVSVVDSVVGNTFNGNGAYIENIERIHSDFIQGQLTRSNSLVNRYETANTLATQLEGIVASSEDGVKSFMQEFFNSVASLQQNPQDDTYRTAMLSEANNFSSQVSNIGAILDETQIQLNNQLTNVADEVNSRLQTIHTINGEVELASSFGSIPPNDLLDQRDQAVLELSQYLDIKVFQQIDGSYDIHTSDGSLPLISGGDVFELDMRSSPYADENRTEAYMTINGVDAVVTDQFKGGVLGGLVDFRNNMLEPAILDLGVTVMGFAEAVNAQHYQGYDKNDEPGGQFFSSVEATATHNINNLGTNNYDGSDITVSFRPLTNLGTGGTLLEPPFNQIGTTGGTLNDEFFKLADKQDHLTSAYDEIGKFQPRDYLIRFDGTQFNFYDKQTGDQLDVYDANGNTITASTYGTGGEDSKYYVDGLEFDLSGVPTTGFAASDEFIVKPYEEMLKGFETQVTNINDIAVKGEDPATSVDPLTSKPAAAPGDDDNVNIANIANLQELKLMFADDAGDATESLLGAYGIMAANVGLYVRSSEIQYEAQTNVFEQINLEKEAYSGVSLDEEAANLLRYQQAYDATAQLISASQSIFQTLMGVIRG